MTKLLQYRHAPIRGWFFLSVMLAGGVSAALAQPSVTGGVVDSATFRTPVVAGSAVLVLGSGLGPVTAVTSTQPQSSLGGTSVKIGGYTAPLFSAGYSQLVVQIPWEVAGQNQASLTVTTSAGTSSSVTVNLVAYQPELYGTIFNPNGNANDSTHPANPGTIVQIPATGLGAVATQQSDGSQPNNIVNTVTPVSATVGGVAASVISAQLCGGNSQCPWQDASYLIAVQVPNVAGAALPVVVTQGTATSNSGTINVTAQSLTINSGPGFGAFQLGPVQISLQASGGTGTGYTWSISSGSLPSGLATRNDGGPSYFPAGATGGILGVATQPGHAAFTLMVTDSGGHTATRDCIMDILSLAITDNFQLADGFLGSLYAYTPTATGATGAVTWSLPNNGLPQGLSLDPSSGKISGSPIGNQGNYGFNLAATDSTGTTTRYFNIQVFALNLTTAGDLGNYTPGSTVNIQLNASGGTGPYNFSAGNLPQGLTLSSTGQLSGTVGGNNGTYRFNVGVNDNAGNSFNKNFVMNIVGTPTLPNVNYPVPAEDMALGESRNYTFNVNGGQSPYIWSISGGTPPPGMVLSSGNLPSGFNIGPDDAVLTGSPTQTGTYTFTVNLKDSSPTPITESQPFTIQVKGLAINYPINAVRGLAYRGYVQPIGETTNNGDLSGSSWQILSGSLPPGLALNTGNGIISGTPTANGNYSVLMSITVAAVSISRYVNFNVQSPTIPQITVNGQPNLPDAAVGQNYNYNVNACCTPTGVTFSLVGSLPAGLGLNGSGQLSGSPSAAGQYEVTIKATDNANSANYGIGIYTLNILPSFSFNLPPSTATVGVAYSGVIAFTSGATGGLAFAEGQGSQLPPGLSFNNGTISGTPASAGQFNLNYIVTDSGNHTFHIYFGIQVYPSGTTPPPNPQFGNNLGTYMLGEVDFGLFATGGNGTYAFSLAGGSLPPGVSIRSDGPYPINSQNGAQAGLVGVATTPGNYTFTIAVSSGGQTSYQSCTMRVTGLNVMDGNQLPAAHVGEYYSYTLTPLNANGNVTLTQNNGSLPNGLTFNNGTISGTPLQAGNFNIGYLVQDSTDTIGRGLNLNVYALHFSTPAVLPNVTQNTAVNLTFQAAGGSGGYAYSANGLPCCLSLSQGGVLSGTINNGPGLTSLQITATDSTQQSYTQTFGMDVIGAPAQLPSVNLGGLLYDPVITIGGNISWAASVSNGGTAPFTWNVTGLPPGVGFRPYSNSGSNNLTPGNIEIWGTPTSLNNGQPYNVTYTVTDNNGVSASVTAPMTISALTVDGNDFPTNTGTVLQPYSKQLRVLGGTAPYSVSQLNPTVSPLPDGLSLNGFTLSGTPLENGNFNPVFRFRDSAGSSFVMLSGMNISNGAHQININDSFFLGNAIIGQNYGHQFNACCTSNGIFNWSVVGGTLPPGITLSATTGQLSGSANTAGTYTFLVQASDPNNPTYTGFRQFMLIATPITVTASTTLPYGNLHSKYDYTIPVSGGNGAVSFQLGSQGPLPAGLSLLSSGELTGTPTVTGQFLFSALLGDTAGNSNVQYFNLSIYPAGSGPPVAINTGANLGTQSIGMIQIPLIASGGTGAYTWSISGNSLPPGLALRTDLPGYFPNNASAGIIGLATVAQANPYTFTLTVTSGTQSASQLFTLKITGLTAMENNGFRLPDAFLGQGYSYTITPLNVNGKATFANPNNLPPGLTLNSDGTISGTPTAASYYNFSLGLSDAVDTVNVGAAIDVFTVQVTSPGTLQNATQNAPYSYAFTASGGSGQYTFTGNGLPGGLSLSQAGVLSGTTTGGPGRYYLNITATDNSTPQTFSYNKVIALDVVSVPVTLPFLNTYGNLDDCTYGAACSRGLSVTNGGVAPFSWQITGLPNGMSARKGSGSSDGVTDSDVELWGTPLQIGSFTVKAVLTDSSTPTPLTATQTFTLRVSPLWLDGSFNLVNGNINVPYSQKLRVLGGSPAASAPLYGAQVQPYELPAGLSLSGMTVSGTPLENGGFSPQFTFTDNASPANSLHVTEYFNIGNPGNTITANTYNFADNGSPNDIIGYFTAGSSVSYQLGACCVPSYTWSKTGGSLPSGLSLSSSGLLNGTISGTATLGAYTFTVQVADPNNLANYGVRQYTLFVTSFNYSSSTTLPYATLNTFYSQQIQVSNSVAATFTVLPGYSLPPGLSMTAGGLISGSPTATGQYSFWVSASNSAKTNDAMVAQFNISVWTTSPPLYLGTGPVLGPVSFGGYNVQLTATGGQPPYHYSFSPGATPPPNYRVQDGGQLPASFQLSQGTGGLIGIVDTVGTYQTSLRVTDSATPPNTFDRPITLITTDLTIPNSNNPPAAYTGTFYSFRFVAYGGSGSYLWSATGLPSGLSMGSTTGTISGTPGSSSSTSFPLSITLTDSNGTAVSFYNYNLTLFPFNITTGQVLPQGTVGQAYPTQTLSSGCGSGCTWSIVGSSGLPSGLSLNSSTGVISGTPNNSYNNWVTIQAKTSGGAFSQKAFAFTILPNTPQPLYISQNSNFNTSAAGNSYTTLLNVQGGKPPYTWSLTNGSLPPGISLLSPGETVGSLFGPGFTYLVGRPMQLGNYNFTLQVTDSAANTTTQTFTWAITQVNLNMTNFPNNGSTGTYGSNAMTVPPVFGQAYSQQILVIGGTGTFTSWATPMASYPLPPGLSVNQSTGVISGTPGATGTYTTFFRVTDTANNTLQQYVNFTIGSGTTSTISLGVSNNLGTYLSGGNQVFNLSPSGGTGPYTITAVGGLPPGCQLETGNALLGNASGSYDMVCAPLSAGTFTFTLRVADSAGNFGQRVLSITFSPLQLYTYSSLSSASAGTAYSQQLLTWDNSGGSVSWSVTPGYALPPGMTLSGGTITGTPSTPGNYSFNLTATDSVTQTSINYAFTIGISAITITTPSLIPTQGVVFQPYSYQLTATGGGSNKTWTATNLPPGLSISTSGLISGTPEDSGNYQLGVTVTDGSSPMTRTLVLYVHQFVPEIPSVAMTQTLLADARLGQSYSATLQPNFGTPPYNWAVAPGSSLPPGLGLYDATAQSQSNVPGITVLGGEPSAAGLYTFDLVMTDGTSATVQRTFTLTVSPIVIESGSLPTPVVGSGYSRQLTVTGGTGPYTYSVSPGSAFSQALPPGLSVSAGGLISGTPTSTGSFPFRVTVTDSATPAHHYTTRYTLTPTNSNGLWVTNSASVPLALGGGNQFQLYTSGNSSYTWSIAAGALPPGMKLNANGMVSGAASAAGNYDVTVRATDNSNSANFADREYLFQVMALQVNYSAPLLPIGTVSSAYSYQFSLAGGQAPYHFTPSSFYPLPAGLTLSDSGLLSGTPTQSGLFTIYAPIVDSKGNAGAVLTGNLVISHAGDPLPVVGNSFQTHDGSAGVAYASSSLSSSQSLDQFFTYAGTAPVSYTVAPGSSLPPGMTFVESGNGVPAFLAGIPTTPGTYTYSVSAVDAAGRTATSVLTTNISPLSISPKLAPNGVAGTVYFLALSASGGSPQYNFQLAPYSDLPPGLTLSSAGVLSGTPTAAGNFNLVVVVTDSSGLSANTLTYIYPMVIDSAAQAPGIGILPLNPIQISYVIGEPAPSPLPVSITTTSGTPAFKATVSGLPGLALSQTSGTAPTTLSLTLAPAGLTAGTYSGVVGVYAPSAVNGVTQIPVVLTVTNPPPCSYALIPSGGTISAAGGSGSFTISTGSLCPWTATPADPFVTVAAASASGTGPGTVQFSLSANGGLSARTSSILAGGQSYSITQFGSTCALAITPASVTVTAAGGLATVNVTTTNQACGWSAASASGLGVSPASGTGNGTVTFTIPSTQNVGSQTLNGSVTLNGGASSPFTVTQTGVGCSVALSANSVEVSASGGEGSVTVTSSGTCSYTTINGPSWISITSGGSGSGPNPVSLTYSVAVNSTTVGRSGTLSIGGTPFTITQDATPCSVTVDAGSSGSPYGVDSGSGTLAIRTNGANCTWTASSPASWVTVSPPYGSGNGTIFLNTTSSNAASTTPRTATLTVAGQNVNVTQGGTVCSYALGSMNASAPYGGGTGAVTVTAPAACGWQALTDPNASWLGIASSGTGGTSSVMFTVAPNNTSTPRTGTLTIAQQQYTVSQAGGPCVYNLSGGQSTNLTSAAGQGQFTFSTTTSGCSTQAVSFANWLTVSTSSSADGTSGTVTFNATANPSGAARNGTIQFAGQTYTVSQLGAACAFGLSSYGLALGKAGGGSTVSGAPSAQGCTPTVGTDQPGIVNLQSLTGPVNDIFSLPFSVVSYNSAVTGIRTMIITFGGQLFTIKQTSW